MNKPRKVQKYPELWYISGCIVEMMYIVHSYGKIEWFIGGKWRKSCYTRDHIKRHDLYEFVGEIK